jgi:hypothetical protein
MKTKKSKKTQFANGRWIRVIEDEDEDENEGDGGKPSRMEIWPMILRVLTIG